MTVWLQRNCRVEKMQFRFPRSSSIICRNSIDVPPGCGPMYTVCIITHHAGRGEWRKGDMFHRVSKASLSLSWHSSIISSWYLSFTRPVHGPCMWLILIRPTASISWFFTVTLGIFLEHCLAAVIVPNIPIPWKVSKPSSVHTLWSAFPALYWIWSKSVKFGTWVPEDSAAIRSNHRTLWYGLQNPCSMSVSIKYREVKWSCISTASLSSKGTITTVGRIACKIDCLIRCHLFGFILPCEQYSSSTTIVFFG